MILAGDIGGTHTRLALFEVSGELNCIQEKKFSSRSYGSLDEIVREFLGDKKVTKACFGIAGVVREGRVHATNLPWMIDTSLLSQSLQIPTVHLLNDLVANAYGIRMLKPEELYLLHPGQMGQKGNGALIAAGTGLGEAGLYWDGKEHRPFACEGGHSDFAPRDEIEIELLQYLMKKYDHVSYERVVSGPGIEGLYHFLIETKRHKANIAIQEEMKKRNPSIVISNWADRDPACSQAIDWFISVYGAEAGNMALKFLAFKGVYIGGGIAPHLIHRMQPFIEAFVKKGRFKSMLASIPIWVIMNDRAALLGAAFYAKRYEG